MKSLQSIKTYVRKLVELSKGSDGLISDERVKAILEVLRKNKPRQLKRILEVFQMKLRTELRKEEAEVEYAGKMTDEVLVDLTSRFQTHYNKQLRVKLIDQPILIGGVRVSVGDDVWDYSIRGRIERLGDYFKN